MLHPSYNELIDKVNEVNEEIGEAPVESRYSMVMALSKRARDLVDGSPMMVAGTSGGRMLSQAVEEMISGKLGISVSEEEDFSEITSIDDMADVDLSLKIDDEE